MIDVATMLAGYRAAAAPFMIEQLEQFKKLHPDKQRELLFWMIVDTATNQRTPSNDGPNGTAA